MTEALLQFIWRLQYFNSSHLETVKGEPLQVRSPGIQNHGEGPDFINAKIVIGDIEWHGSVELHLETSGWNKHRHDHDPNYGNVILHVVWKHDKMINDIPLVELSSRVPGVMLDRYEGMMNQALFIPCEKEIGNAPSILMESWKERLIAERFHRRSAEINELLFQNNHHWDEICWWLLARNFGRRINSTVFETVARSVPVKVLYQYSENMMRLEALLLGQAGFLSVNARDPYLKQLSREYEFLKNKHKLKPVYEPVFHLRLRPQNFPAIRLAQLAALISRTSNFILNIISMPDIKTATEWLKVAASTYWSTHYRPGKKSAHSEKKLGEEMVENILLNTVIPLLYTYGDYFQKEELKTRAISWLQAMQKEDNSVIRKFVSAGIQIRSAFDSQALLEMKKMYCDERRCLECRIGAHLLGKLVYVV